jgi:hypothetical protein
MLPGRETRFAAGVRLPQDSVAQAATPETSVTPARSADGHRFPPVCVAFLIALDPE